MSTVEEWDSTVRRLYGPILKSAVADVTLVLACLRQERVRLQISGEVLDRKLKEIEASLDVMIAGLAI